MSRDRLPSAVVLLALPARHRISGEMRTVPDTGSDGEHHSSRAGKETKPPFTEADRIRLSRVAAHTGFEDSKVLLMSATSAESQVEASGYLT
jgi:hypothetical protein